VASAARRARLVHGRGARHRRPSRY
jgi:hypothetical protein